MTEHEMRPGQDIVIQPETRIRMGAALNAHAVSKDLAMANIDHMRQEETMQRILGLASTREGLAALIETQNK